MTRAGIPLDEIAMPIDETVMFNVPRRLIPALSNIIAYGMPEIQADPESTDEERAEASELHVSIAAQARVMAATPEPALNDDDPLLHLSRAYRAIDPDTMDDPCAVALRAAYRALEDVTEDNPFYSDVTVHALLMNYADAMAEPELTTTDCSLITRAADYIAADRAWRDAWSRRLSTASTDAAEYERLHGEAQMARMRFGDEDVTGLRRIGAR